MSSAKVYALNLNENKDWTLEPSFTSSNDDFFDGDREEKTATNATIIDVDFGAPVSLAGVRISASAEIDLPLEVQCESSPFLGQGLTTVATLNDPAAVSIDMTWGYVQPRRYWRLRFASVQTVYWVELKTYEEYVAPSPYPPGSVILSNANIRVKYYDFYSVTLKALASMRFPSSSCTVAFFGYL